MTLTTTTHTLVRDQMIAKLKAITPTLISNIVFDECKPNQLIRDWTKTNASKALFRAFQFTLLSTGPEPNIFDSLAIEREENLLLTVAYPVLVGLYGARDLDSMEDVIRSDARQIRDAITSPGNYVDGQLLARVTIDPMQRDNQNIWFQDFTINVRFYEGQTLV